MKCLSFALAARFACTFAALAQNGVLDVSTLAQYANQPKPAYITKSNTPGTNPITDAGATLGRVLFYDKRLSRNNRISCASCHRQAFAFSDPGLASTGVATGLQYQLQSSTDLNSWSTQGTLTPDASGNLTATVSTTGPVFYRFAYNAP